MLRVSPHGWSSQYLFGFFFSYGIYLPFWAVWLSSMGMSAPQIGWLTGLGLVTRALCNLLVTPRIYRAEQLVPAIRWITLGALLTVALHLLAGNQFWVLAVITVMFNLLYAPLIPLSDALVNHYHRRQLLDYGRTRLWGSIAFVISNWVVGWMSDSYGEGIIPWLALAGLVFALLLSARQPTIVPTTQGKPHQRPALTALLQDSLLIRFLLITSLLQGCHAAYYAFSAVHWRGAGITDTHIGMLWSFGVICEILTFRFGWQWFRGWRVSHMMRLAAVAVVIRWLTLGLFIDLPTLFFSQSLHSITFAATHLAAIKYIQQQQESVQMAWQSLYNAVPLGLVLGVLTIATGPIYAWLQGGAFIVMIAMALPVLWLALPDKSPLMAAEIQKPS